MCPEDKNEYHPLALKDEPTNPETERALVKQLIERYAPNVKQGDEPRVVMVVDDGRNNALIGRIQALAATNGLNVVLVADPSELVPETRPQRRQVAVLDHGGGISIARALIAAMQSCRSYEAAEVPLHCSVVEDVLDPPKVVRHHQNETSFKQHQNNFKGKGPPTRRTFAQIRPPRRGGRS